MGRKRWLFDKVNQITMEEFKTLQKDETSSCRPRGASEYNAGHIKGADNVFVGLYRAI
jgi:hydroxyacylglutathione hydrolase